LNHEEHEENEFVQYVIADQAVTVRVNSMAAAGFKGTLIFFVFLRTLRSELLFLGSTAFSFFALFAFLAVYLPFLG
jgi:hypothetical protein